MLQPASAFASAAELSRGGKGVGDVLLNVLLGRERCGERGRNPDLAEPGAFVGLRCHRKRQRFGSPFALNGHPEHVIGFAQG